MDETQAGKRPTTAPDAQTSPETQKNTPRGMGRRAFLGIKAAERIAAEVHEETRQREENLAAVRARLAERQNRPKPEILSVENGGVTAFIDPHTFHVERRRGFMAELGLTAVIANLPTVPNWLRNLGRPNLPEKPKQQELVNVEAPATLAMTAEQVKDLKQTKAEILLGKEKYEEFFDIYDDGQVGLSVVGMPTSWLDENSDLGKYMRNSVLPVAAGVLQADPDRPLGEAGAGKVISLVVCVSESPKSAAVQVGVVVNKDLALPTRSGQKVAFGSGSIITFTSDGREMHGIAGNEAGVVVDFVTLTPELYAYLKRNNTKVNPDNLPAIGDSVLMKVKINPDDPTLATPLALYVPGFELIFTTEMGVPPLTPQAPRAKFGEMVSSGNRLNVEQVADREIPAEILKKLGPWTIRIGETGWIVDYSKATRFQKYVEKIGHSVPENINITGYVYIPEAKAITNRFADYLKDQLATPEYQAAHNFAITPSGKVVEIPKFTTADLPVVVVETHDWTDLGGGGNPKGELGKTAFRCPNDTDTFVRYWDPKKRVLTIKRYLAKGQDASEPKNTGAFGDDAHIFAAAIQWGYLGSQNLEKYWTQWWVDMFIQRIPGSNVGYTWLVPNGSVDGLRAKIAKSQGK